MTRLVLVLKRGAKLFAVFAALAAANSQVRISSIQRAGSGAQLYIGWRSSC